MSDDEAGYGQEILETPQYLFDLNNDYYEGRISSHEYALRFTAFQEGRQSERDAFDAAERAAVEGMLPRAA